MTNGITIRNFEEEKKITKIPETLSAPNFRILDLSVSPSLQAATLGSTTAAGRRLAMFTVLQGMRLARGWEGASAAEESFAGRPRGESCKQRLSGNS